MIMSWIPPIVKDNQSTITGKAYLAYQGIAGTKGVLIDVCN